MIYLQDWKLIHSHCSLQVLLHKRMRRITHNIQDVYIDILSSRIQLGTVLHNHKFSSSLLCLCYYDEAYGIHGYTMTRRLGYHEYPV